MNNERPDQEQRDFLGRGWSMPVELDPRSGRVKRVEFEEDVRQSMRIILETAPGERVMRPDFGCGIHDLVFASLSASTIGRVDREVHEALLRLEPRIDVLSVQITPDEAGSVLLINIEYEVRATNTAFNLVYPFYLQQGAGV
jgi:phage baseplate assembly protein W